LRAAGPTLAWQPLAIGLSAYVASAALVFHWGRAVYGPHGALAATALAAFAPVTLIPLVASPAQAVAGATTLVGSCAYLATLYALMRCVLDPTLFWVALAGVAIAAVPVGAVTYAAPSAIVTGLAALSLLLVVGRVLVAERSESQPRVAQASAVAVALAWTVALALVVLIDAFSHLPSAEEYSAVVPPARLSATRAASVGVVPAVLAADLEDPRAAGSSLAALPVAALLLAAVRPWRPQRRFTDGGWTVALLCLPLPLWLTSAAPGAVFATPIAALLAGACWDASRPAWARQAARLLVVMQGAAALLLWPYAPAPRADAVAPVYRLAAGISDSP
jgi:hypothetical protein